MSSAEAAATELRPVPGPVAFSGGWRRFLSLLWLNARADFKVRYSEAALGYVWSLIRPLALFGILYLVFTRFVRFAGADLDYYAAMLLLGIMLFHLFGDPVTASVRSVVRSERIVRKTQFPRAVIPLSVVMIGCLTFALNLVAVVALIFASGQEPRLSWLLMPFVVLLFVVLAATVSMLCSALYTRFRDIDQIWAVLNRVLFYGSPIIFPVEFVPDDWRFLLVVNPLAPLFIETRRLVFDPDAPGVMDVTGNAWGLVGPALVFVGLCVVGVWYFVRRAPRIAEDL